MLAALSAFRALGDNQRTAITLLGLAGLYEQAGRCAEAQRAHDEALPVLERSSPLLRLGYAHCTQGLLYLRLGQFDEAERQLRLALRRTGMLRDRDGELRARLALGQVELGRGRFPEAQRMFRELVADCAGSGGFVETMAHTGLGTAQAGLGRQQDAMRLHMAALGLAVARSAEDLRAVVLNDLAETHWSSGSREAAAGYHRSALSLAREVGLEGEEERARRGLARIQAIVG